MIQVIMGEETPHACPLAKLPWIPSASLGEFPDGCFIILVFKGCPSEPVMGLRCSAAPGVIAKQEVEGLAHPLVVLLLTQQKSLVLKSQFPFCSLGISVQKQGIVGKGSGEVM